MHFTKLVLSIPEKYISNCLLLNFQYYGQSIINIQIQILKKQQFSFLFNIDICFLLSKLLKHLHLGLFLNFNLFIINTFELSNIHKYYKLEELETYSLVMD